MIDPKAKGTKRSVMDYYYFLNSYLGNGLPHIISIGYFCFNSAERERDYAQCDIIFISIYGIGAICSKTFFKEIRAFKKALF